MRFVVVGVQPKSFHDQREERQLVIPILKSSRNNKFRKKRMAKSKFRKPLCQIESWESHLMRMFIVL